MRGSVEFFIEKIHLILDQRLSSIGKNETSSRGIEYQDSFLPAYSPNLNSLKRRWTVMNEHVRHNVFFPSSKLFKIKNLWNFFTVHEPRCFRI